MGKNKNKDRKEAQRRQATLDADRAAKAALADQQSSSGATVKILKDQNPSGPKAKVKPNKAKWSAAFFIWATSAILNYFGSNPRILYLPALAFCAFLMFETHKYVQGKLKEHVEVGSQSAQTPMPTSSSIKHRSVVKVAPGPSTNPKAAFGTEFILSNEGPDTISNVLYYYLVNEVKVGKIEISNNYMGTMTPILSLEPGKQCVLKISIGKSIETGNMPIQEANISIVVEYDADWETTGRHTDTFPFFFEMADNGDAVWLPHVEQ